MATSKKGARRCPVHGGEIHGGEAEELRAGLEGLMKEGNVTSRGVQRLLDRVDARDSLAHLEVRVRPGRFCFEPEEPELSFGQCPAIGVGGRHSESYGQEGEHRCDWCGARPVLPVRSAGKRVFGRTCDRPCAEPS